jgi:RND superfamily putative drug exporter
VAGTALTLKVTGNVALAYDNQSAFDSALVIIFAATILLIIVLLLVIYRSPIAALLPILTVGIVSFIAQRLIAVVAELTGLQVDQSLQIILTIVLYGIGTDYILFMLFRYREGCAPVRRRRMPWSAPSRGSAR